MFELSHITATDLLSATIIATKCVDGWITDNWSQLFLQKDPTPGNDISKSFSRLLRQLVFVFGVEDSLEKDIHGVEEICLPLN